MRTHRTDVEGTTETHQADTGYAEYTKTHGWRNIGYRIRTFLVDVSELLPNPDLWVGWYEDQDTGVYFAFNTSATRDRVNYGASTPDRLFKTEEARARAISVYTAGTAKRAVALERKSTIAERS